MLDLLKKRSFGAMTLTQFLGAFNDNAFKMLIILLVASLDGENAPEWVASSSLAQNYGQGLVAFLFALPFVVLGPITGALADKLPKSRIIRAANVLEILVMGCGALALMAHSYEGLLAVVFLMGAQSALFGPAKYGVIKELVGEAELGRANAVIQSSTMVAILMGNLAAGFIAMNVDKSPWICGLWYVGFATVGWLASLRIPKLPAADPDRRVAWNPVTEFVGHWNSMEGNRRLMLAVLASGMFYLLAALFISMVVQYGTYLGVPQQYIGPLNGATIIGVVIGAMIAGRMCKDHVEGGLIPLGLLGMAASAFLMLLAPESVIMLVFSLLGIGIFSGIFTIPIRCLIQGLPKDHQRGGVQGLAETTDFVGILIAGVLFTVLDKKLGLNAPTTFLIGGLMTLALAITSLVLVGEYALRLLLLILCRTFYRIRVYGARHVPNHGGVLLVANHVSLVDALLVTAACPRPVRFLMYRDYFKVPVLGWFARRLGVMPISSKDSPELRREALALAAQKAAEGEVVCIFAEGAVTRTGAMSAFASGFERIARDSGVPIVPLALDRFWGSIFTYSGGKVVWKLPNRLVHPVDLCFGEPMASDSNATQVRQSIAELIADLRRERKGRRGSLAWRFLYKARRQGGRMALVDSGGKRLTYRKLLVGSLALRSLLRRKLGREERVAILLPPCAGGALANIVLALLRKVSVNLNYTMPNSALQVSLDEAEVKQVITSRRFLKVLERPSPLPEEQTLYLEDLVGEITTGDKLGALLRSWLPAAWLAHLCSPQRSASEVATVIFSSGSTGTPKGVQLTHANVLSNVQSVLQVFALGPGDSLLGVLPLFHSFGYTITLWANFLGGSKVVYHPNPLEAKTIGELCEAEEVTVTLATPSLYQSYLRRCRPEAFAKVRLCISGAQKLPASLAKAWQERMGVELLEGYGATELSPVASVNLPNPRKAGPRHHSSRPGSVGKPIPGVAVRVVHPETKELLEPGVEGLIEIKGANVMLGYLGRPEATADVLHDGWYVTGDIGKLDVDGFLWLTDRLSRFSKIGGEMVPHGRIEEALYELLPVDSSEPDEDALVPELAVTAIEHETRGEELVVLCANLPMDAEALAEGLRASELPRLFQPRASHYLSVEEIPKLGTGKTDLRALRELAKTQIASQA